MNTGYPNSSWTLFEELFANIISRTQTLVKPCTSIWLPVEDLKSPIEILILSIFSGRELGRVALPTVQMRLALSGKLCFNSLWPVTNVTGQGNELRSWIVKEKRGGPGITVEAKKTQNTNPQHAWTHNETVTHHHSGTLAYDITSVNEGCQRLVLQILLRVMKV